MYINVKYLGTRLNGLTLILILILFSSVSHSLLAQETLEDYVQEGLANNLALKQKRIPVEQAELFLKTAHSYFLPTVSLKADYTSGEGGRAIDIPVGDMLNPVYSTLNTLTNSNAFPQIKNVKEDFLPFQFYDAKIRTSAPLLNTDLIFNSRIQEVAKTIKEQDYERYKLDLIKEIKTAYYNYLSTTAAIKILEQTKQLAHEAKRVNQSLLEKGAGLPVYVIRAEGELESINAKIISAEGDKRAASKYFNFLLNKPLYSEIKTFQPVNSFTAVNDSLEGERLELSQIKNGIKMHELHLTMQKYQWMPKINAFIDAGVQDRLQSYKNSSRYYLFGLMMEMPLFESWRGVYRQEEAALGIKESSILLEETAQKLRLSRDMASDRLITAEGNLSSAGKQLKTAQAYLSLIDKGYKEGINTFIETVDARAQYMQAAQYEQICKYRLLVARAEFDRETSYTH